jgi:hypothetical protein
MAGALRGLDLPLQEDERPLRVVVQEKSVSTGGGL